MCHVGCRYEYGSGDSCGECRLGDENPPRDAMCSVDDLSIEHDRLKAENAELRDEIKQLKFRDITLSLMIKLMHLAISYMQERTNEVAVFDGIRLTAGYFERRMAALGIEAMSE